MKYDFRKRSLRLSTRDADQAGYSLIYVIQNIRDMAKLPRKGYQWEKAMGAPQFAEAGVLKAAEAMGIDLGADRFGQLDVSGE